jgi:predicted RNA binding protein YcfA (HicA-like mRNA interferase family)
MSPKPPLLSGRDLVKCFIKFGYRKVSQKGSHIKMKNDETGSIV